ncbi:hypothetical protein MML48_5g00018361 [Holotrichia oblita]|uniref:Uncharacterized protein n=1 Tax=Holotrichia oblita TaxID=644536 RepID=A0ACB9T3Y6_HOLOL|nr:hypothetical protein MML48_5g00018361 [Holotrichia oblita]
MPPKKKEQKQRYFFQYNEENLKNAIKAVRENGTSKKLAARQFGIPRSTLIRKLAENVPLYRKMGPQTVLSIIEEQLLENWILAMARKGFPVHKNNLLLTVQTIIKEAGGDTCFKDSLPGRTWFEAFLKRHPRIKQKHAESVSKARAAVTQDHIEAWFDEIHQFLKQEKLDGILEDESRIFNGDETGFMLCPKSGKVLGPAANNEDFYQRVSAEKEQITVMAAFSADDYSKCLPNRKVTLFNKDDFSKKVLLKVEQKMEREELNAFLDTYSNKRAWTDNVESVNLYKVWSALKNEVVFNDNSQEIVTVENSGPTIDEIPNNEQSVENQESAEFSDKNEDALTRLEAIDAKEEGYKVPTPFKKCLFLPKTPEKSSTPKRKRVIFPAVVSSSKYREFYNSKKSTSTPKLKVKKQKQLTVTQTIESTSESEDNVPYDDEDVDISEPDELVIEIGTYVIVRYERNYYPGIVLKTDEEGMEVKTMKKAGLDWRWPEKDDILYYFKEDIVCAIDEPLLKNKRGFYCISKMNKYI